MIDSEFSAYVEGLPPADRITVEQALAGLRDALSRDEHTPLMLESNDNVLDLTQAMRRRALLS